MKIPKVIRRLLMGAASILDICPVSRKAPKIRIQSDEEAIRSDWEKIGKDFKSAIQNENDT